MATPPTYPGSVVQARPVATTPYRDPEDRSNELLGNVLTAAGKQAQQFEQLAEQRQNDIDEAAAKDLDSEWMAYERDLMWGTDEAPGYMMLNGKDALNARPKVDEALAKKAAELKAKAGGGQQRQQMFSSVIDRRLNAAADVSAQHGMREAQTYKLQATQGRQGVAADLAARQFSDPEAQRRSILTGVVEVREQGRLEGWDAATIKDKTLDYTSSIHTRAVASLIQTDPLGAKIYLDTHAGEIEAGALASLQGQVKGQAETVVAFGLADELYAKGGYIGGMQAAAGIKNPGQRAAVEARLDTIQSRTAKAKSLAEGAMWENVAARLATGATVAEMNPQERAALAASGMMDNALTLEKSLREGSAPPANGNAFLALSWEASNDPAAFATRDLKAYATNMQPKEWLDLVQTQAGTKKAWADGFKTDVDRITTELLPKAMVLKPATGEAAKAAKAQIEAFALAEVRNIRDTQKREVTDADIKQIIQRAVSPAEDGGDRKKLFYESKAGALYRDRTETYLAVRTRYQAVNGKSPTREQILDFVSRADGGKAIARFKDIPASFLPKSRAKMTPADLERAYTDFIMGK